MRGHVFKAPKHWTCCSRSLSRKVKGSANRRRAKQRLARLHARIANVRSDGLHRLTTSLTRRFHTVVLEDPDALPLSVRAWDCPACGAHHDRDVNAAVNLKNLAASSAVSVCGKEGSGVRRKVRLKPASAKQEVSFDPVCA